MMRMMANIGGDDTGIGAVELQILVYNHRLIGIGL